MQERYSKIFKYKENTYTDGSPVIISAGALLSDNVTNNIVAQLKFQSVSQKNIKALTVGVMQLDTAERVLGEEIRHQYLDLSINIGEMFGSKVAIPLTDNSTRCFSARVIEVVFSDNSVWESDNTAIWEELTLPKRQIDDAELIKQFKIKHGFEYKNHLKKEKDLWFCFCGAVNKDERCHICGSELSKLKEFDIVTLKCECDKRLIEEKEERERRQEELRIKQLKEKEEAEIRTKKYKKIVAIGTPIFCIAIALGVILKNIIIPSFMYKKAVCFLKDNSIIAAYETFNEIIEYKDSKQQASLIYEKYKVETLKVELQNAYKGDIVTFGEYEQDNNISNGKERIDWIVLDIKDGEAVLMSKYALDNKAYDERKISWQYEIDSTWETCTLRNWLNNTFLNSAFSSEDKSIICKSNVEAQENPKYSTNAGNSTIDYIFILSSNEAEKYLINYDEKNCRATAYAKSQGAEIDDNGNCFRQWLRTPGGCIDVTPYLTSDGEIDLFGDIVCSEEAIRPVLIVKYN